MLITTLSPPTAINARSRQPYYRFRILKNNIVKLLFNVLATCRIQSESKSISDRHKLYSFNLV